MKYLVTAATDFELQAFAESGGDLARIPYLVTGIGPLETAVRLSEKLQGCEEPLAGVLNFGVAGAYPENGTEVSAGLLDICLAEREVLGDLGICLREGFERFSEPRLQAQHIFPLDRSLLDRAGRALTTAGLEWKSGTFVTVNCASGTRRRGNILATEFTALCENMEGAAVARVCARFALPCVEMRCVSNMVEDRDVTGWRLKEACRLAGRAAVVLCNALSGHG